MKTLSNLINKYQKQASGFSLIEVSVSMVILGTVLAYAMPIILQSKISSSKSQVRAGAMAVSQKIFDGLRGRNFSSIPATDTTVTNLTDTALPSTALGKSYNVSVRYCEPKGTPPTSECTPNYRTFKITVRDRRGNQTSEQSIIYEMEAAFTDFR
jgi:prepilin-type N-terminal cleavage/methylation domain-containing protein